ncbi:hypothetical protein B0H66DRAFT_562978 [Apodospora peruviana]|uniref:Nicotinamide-nucleotide adenylyltransferase n=1 Tax=Apodospora peruviana TaxID=516989 RepID=A0AAE0M0K5_9PEZI|nr:hypothetical protein B0H66DRAFT_562978 [Apodospora peruviana]
MSSPDPPTSPMIEKPFLQAAVASRQQSIVDFFSRALSSFQKSGSPFQVVCTAVKPSPSHDTLLPAPIPPSRRLQTLIVLDSSFNPPTIAHLRMVTSAIRDLTAAHTRPAGVPPLQQIRLLLLLAVNNADKAPKPAAFDQRLGMMWAFANDIHEKLALDAGHLNIDVGLTTEPYFHDKSRVIDRSGFYHYSSDTEREYDDQVDNQVILAGYDTLVRILNPKYYGGLMRMALNPFFERAKLRVTLRTDDEWGGKDDQLAFVNDLRSEEGLVKIGGSKQWADRIEMVEGRQDGEEVVSSTYAREAAKNGDSDKLGRMVSPRVREWIEGQKLYV